MGDNLNNRAIVFIGFILVLLTGLLNPGIIALDDYYYAMAKIVPAQRLSIEAILSNVEIRSPFPLVCLYCLGQLSLFLGLLDPLHQIAFSLSLLGLFSFSIHILVAYQLPNYIYPKQKSQQELLRKSLLLLFCFYGILPLVYTRPMIEALSMPFVSLFVLYLFKYRQSSFVKDLFISLLFLVIASMFRFQVGCCVVVPIVTLFISRRWHHLLYFLSFATVLFVLSGLPDFYWSGTLHMSLYKYLTYNLEHSKAYGAMGHFNYLYLLIMLTFSSNYIL